MKFARFVLIMLAAVSSFCDGRRVACPAERAGPAERADAGVTGVADAPEPEVRHPAPLCDPEARVFAVFRPAAAGAAASVWERLLALAAGGGLPETAAPQWAALTVAGGPEGPFAGCAVALALRHDPSGIDGAFAGTSWKACSLAGELILLATSDDLLHRQIELYARGGDGEPVHSPLRIVVPNAGALVEEWLARSREGDSLRLLIPSADRLLPSLGRLEAEAHDAGVGMVVSAVQRMATADDAVELVSLLRDVLAAVRSDASVRPGAEALSALCEEVTLSSEGATVRLQVEHGIGSRDGR